MLLRRNNFTLRRHLRTKSAIFPRLNVEWFDAEMISSPLEVLSGQITRICGQGNISLHLTVVAFQPLRQQALQRIQSCSREALRRKTLIEDEPLLRELSPSGSQSQSRLSGVFHSLYPFDWPRLYHEHNSAFPTNLWILQSFQIWTQCSKGLYHEPFAVLANSFWVNAALTISRGFSRVPACVVCPVSAAYGLAHYHFTHLPVSSSPVISTGAR
ncbi:hypothetical protein MAP00_006457 [Monascus purpureus]|nr:hypothetical protein MAP00_006457 [Monascus purpureus]